MPSTLYNFTSRATPNHTRHCMTIHSPGPHPRAAAETATASHLHYHPTGHAAAAAPTYPPTHTQSMQTPPPKKTSPTCAVLRSASREAAALASEYLPSLTHFCRCWSSFCMPAQRHRFRFRQASSTWIDRWIHWRHQARSRVFGCFCTPAQRHRPSLRPNIHTPSKKQSLEF